jgi:putative DNA primase/helicase
MEKQRETDGPLPSKFGIEPHHLEQLAASGITPEAASRNGIYSETNSRKIASILGWKSASKLGTCLVFPVKDRDGQVVYHRVKPDSPRTIKGKPIKYESPKGSTLRPYFPHGAAGCLDDASSRILFTEGEKKSVAATEAGFKAIGLFGVFAWKLKDHQKLLPELERINWSGRQVFICFDSDVTSKPNVAQAESQLAAVLESKGAVVRCVRLPDGPGGEKWGVDDYLVANGPKAFSELLDDAHEPQPPEEDCFKVKLDSQLPEVAAQEFIDSTRHNGVLTLRWWAGSFWKWSGGRYQELTPNDVKSELVRFLSARYTDIRSTSVGNVFLNVASHCCVLSSSQPPRWLDGGDERARAWKPEDMFATRSDVINLSKLDAGEDDWIVEASPNYFCMTAADYEFKTDAPPPERWLNFLNQVWPDDPDSIRLLRQWMGYLLTPDTRQQKALLIVGPKRSGKGTVLRVIRQLIGEANCVAPTLASLAGDFGLSPLLGKSAALVGDARLSRRSDLATITERILSITGEDAQAVNRKFKDAITTKLQTRFTICSNELPRLDDSSGALAGRLLLLRMTESFYGREDKSLSDDLESERQSILLWAIGGWMDLRRTGRFVEPSSSDEMVEQLSDLSSPVSAFVRECCQVGHSHTVPLDKLYREYKAWAEEAGQDRVPIRAHFSRDLSAAFPKIQRSRQRAFGTGGTGDDVRETVLVGIGLQY